MCDFCAGAPVVRIRKRDEIRIVAELRKIEAIAKADAFERIEAELAELLQLEWDEASRAAIEDALSVLRAGGDGTFTQADLDAMLSALRAQLGAAFPARVKADVEDLVRQAYDRGFVDVDDTLVFDLVDERAIEWLKAHNVYWVQGHFDDHVRERIVDLGEQVIREGLGRFEAGEVFARELGPKLGQSQTYYEGLAATATTRSREFGRAEAYQKSGAEKLVIQAVLDRRTSSVCRKLHGTVFHVSQAVELRDAIIAAATPEDVKKVAPWLKPAEVEELDLDNLPAHLALPPFHFFCRTRTVVFKG